MDTDKKEVDIFQELENRINRLKDAEENRPNTYFNDQKRSTYIPRDNSMDEVWLALEVRQATLIAQRLGVKSENV